MAASVTVLGGGIVGLTTALAVQDEIKGAKVTLIADKFTRDTTSDGAAGIFRPGSSFSGPSADITKRWIQNAWDYYDNLGRSDEAVSAGVQPVSGYIFTNRHRGITRNHLMEGIVPVYRDATPEELQLCPGSWSFGAFFTTVLVEGCYFLPWATKKFEVRGGVVKRQVVHTLTDLADTSDVVINCSGLGAHHLCNDHKLVPIRGQVIKVRAPWIKTCFYGDYDTYIIPGRDAVTLGGCRNFDSWDTESSPHDSAAIWERCTKLVPSLHQSERLREWVGLRPHRDPVRVEAELISRGFGHRPVKVVHNYGHGGYGMTSAPGTAIDAAKLAKDLLSSTTTHL